MKYIFLALGLLILGQPVAAQAQQATCAQDFYCICSFPSGPLLDEDVQSGGECQSRCIEESLFHQAAGEDFNGTYTFTCHDAAGNLISDNGDATAPSALEQAPSTDQEAHAPLIPILNVQIPGLDFANSVTVDPETGIVHSNILGLYVTALYRYLIGAAALIAVVLLMVAGVQYATAGGSQEKVSKAKNRMRDAIVGIVILLLVYDIAFLIDPNTVKFDSLTIQNVHGIDLIPPGGEDDLVRTGVALSGDTVPLTGSYIIPPTDAALDADSLAALQEAAIDFFDTYQRNILVTSAARTLEKQASLFYSNCLATGGVCSVPTCNPAAGSSIITHSGGRYVLSGALANVSSSSTIISTIVANAKPANCPHTSAVAIDAWCEGSGNYQADPSCQQALIQTMVEHGFCRLSSEVWHFELNSKHVSTNCLSTNDTISYSTLSGTTYSPGGDCQKWDFKNHKCVVQRPH